MATHLDSLLWYPCLRRLAYVKTRVVLFLRLAELVLVLLWPLVGFWRGKVSAEVLRAILETGAVPDAFFSAHLEPALMCGISVETMLLVFPLLVLSQGDTDDRVRNARLEGVRLAADMLVPLWLMIAYGLTWLSLGLGAFPAATLVWVWASIAAAIVCSCMTCVCHYHRRKTLGMHLLYGFFALLQVGAFALGVALPSFGTRDWPAKQWIALLLAPLLMAMLSIFWIACLRLVRERNADCCCVSILLATVALWTTASYAKAMYIGLYVLPSLSDTPMTAPTNNDNGSGGSRDNGDSASGDLEQLLVHLDFALFMSVCLAVAACAGICLTFCHHRSTSPRHRLLTTCDGCC